MAYTYNPEESRQIYSQWESLLPTFAGTQPDIEKTAEAGIRSQLGGQLAPGMATQLADVARQQQGRLAKMGILTGGQTYPSVLKAQSEQLLFPAYQQALQTAMGLGERQWQRSYQPWQTRFGGLQQAMGLAAESPYRYAGLTEQQRQFDLGQTLERELTERRLKSEEENAQRLAKAQENVARGQAIGGIASGLGSGIAASLFSDENLKENITTIKNPLEKITQLRGVNFEWKDKENFPHGVQMGLIAQEVTKVVPEVVEKKGDYYAIQYEALIGLVIEAIKELQKRD